MTQKFDPKENYSHTREQIEYVSRKEATQADYDRIGFMSGLEVHQQLKTKEKLFCRCPAGLFNKHEDYNAEVIRHMRPTLSELGEYDGTALMEFKTRKEIVYLLERGTVCTYEMDDTPPFEIDDEAVRIAIEMSELCNLNLVSELHVMRKQYLDGSIPTGFQRTAMVGLTGSIPFQVPELGIDRDLSIRQLSLEEDSCREVSDIGHRIVFRTDRLGMPLTEMVTEPELRTPQELQAGARVLAQLARASGKVRRGPGAARQDVNVSVAGGRRVEIKGVYHHRSLPLLVHREAFRQLNLLRVKAELEARGSVVTDLQDPPPGLPWETSDLVFEADVLLLSSNFHPVRQAIAQGDSVCAVRLPGFAGLLDHSTQPGITFAHEIADRIRVIACPLHTPFMTHSGVAEDGVSAGNWKALAKELGAGSQDAMVVVWAPEADLATAVREVILRAREALEGIPSETRQAQDDCTNGFERILPGPDRMYPDTDTPPIPIHDTMVEEVRAQVGEPPWERRARYEAMGLDTRTGHLLSVAPWAGLFDQVAPKEGPTARRLATVLEKRVPFHSRRLKGVKPLFAGDVPDADRLAPIVRAVEVGDILAEAMPWAVDEVLSDPDKPVSEVVGKYRPRESDSEVLETVLVQVVGRMSSAGRRGRDEVLQWGVGEVMREFFGRIPSQEVLTRLVALFDPENEVSEGKVGQ